MTNGSREGSALVSGLRSVKKYAPLQGPMLNRLVTMLRAAAPQWTGDRKDAQARARKRHNHVRVDGADWYWPAGESPLSARHEESRGVRLLAPFDPVVWDRMRFEAFWGWAYRFEAYTPASKRKLGYYALPLLWDDQVIGWGQDGAFITGDNVNPHLAGSVFYFLEGYAVYAIRDVIKPIADGNPPPLKADAGDPASRVEPCPVTAEQAAKVPDMAERVKQLLAAPAGTTEYALFCPNK